MLINVEINTYVSNSLRRRNAGYIFKKYSELTRMGDSYNSMPMVIQINLSDLNNKEICYKYSLYDKTNNKTYIDNLEIYEYNITKIKEMCYNKPSRYKLLSLLDCDLEELNALKGDDKVERIKEEIKYLNEDPEFVRYMSDEDEARLLKNTLKTDAYEEGIQKGIKQQKEISKKELKQQKELNDQKLKSTVKTLKENNVSIDIIIKSTGLTEDEVNSI